MVVPQRSQPITISSVHLKAKYTALTAGVIETVQLTVDV